MITRLNLPWVSPTLKIRFERFEDGLQVVHPKGTLFKDFEALANAMAQDKLREEQVQAQRNAAFAKLRELRIDPQSL